MTDKVLIVDDSRVSLAFLQAIVEDAGFEAITARSADEATTILHGADSFVAMVFDWIMPGMSGLELLKNVKQDDKWKYVPVIMQTAKADKESIKKGINAGAYHYLTKPFKEETMRSILKDAIDVFKKITGKTVSEIDEVAAWDHIREGRFCFRTIEEGRKVAKVMSKFTNNEKAIYGLEELFINAVEHGNLQITYSEKSELLENEKLEEEIERRLNSFEHKNKVVDVMFKVGKEVLEVYIKDQGKGFDYKKYLDFDPERAFDLHGRGIAIANKECFQELEYFGKGNQVMVKSTRD